jgi:Tn3 transposase DDE domain
MALAGVQRRGSRERLRADGLMHNDVVQSDIHSTDAFGYSEAIFGTSHLVGVSYAPRFKNLKRQRLVLHPRSRHGVRKTNSRLAYLGRPKNGPCHAPRRMGRTRPSGSRTCGRTRHDSSCEKRALARLHESVSISVLQSTGKSRPVNRRFRANVCML